MSIDDDSDDNGPQYYRTFKATKLDMFYGDRNKFEDQINQLDMYLMFEEVPPTKKASIATTFLRSNAQYWAKPFLRRFLDSEGRDDPDNMFKNYTVFKNKMKELYSISNEVTKATHVIQGLRQTISASEYTAKFTEYSQILGWNDKSLIVMYRRGLKLQVKD